jgi:hypothetical protein
MPEKKAFLLRLNQDLYEAILKLSQDEFRSVNAQIEFILRDALHKRGRLKSGENLQKEENGSE